MQRPVNVKSRPRLPIPDEDPYSIAGNGRINATDASDSSGYSGGSGSGGSGGGNNHAGDGTNNNIGVGNNIYTIYIYLQFNFYM